VIRHLRDDTQPPPAFAAYGHGQPAPSMPVMGQPSRPIPRARGPVVYAPPPPGHANPTGAGPAYPPAEQAPLYSAHGYTAHYRGGDDPAAWSTSWGPVDDYGHNPVAVSARNEVIARMAQFSHTHAQLAWDARKSQRICPHAIAFLYADPQPIPDDPAPNPPQNGGRVARPYLEPTDRQRRLRTLRFYRIAAATRLDHDTPDVRELPELLYRLANLARTEYLPKPGGFDPAVQLSLHQDATSAHAPYVGVGVSTLDTPGTTWEQTTKAAQDHSDVGGRCYALLFDHTALLIDRGPPRRVRNELGVHATTDLNYEGGVAPRLWTHHPDVSTMTAPLEVWDQMHTLHQLVYHQTPRPTL
jgi:hypothetical protein